MAHVVSYGVAEHTILELSDTNMLVESYVFHLIIDSQADKLVGQVASHAQRQIPAWKAE